MRTPWGNKLGALSRKINPLGTSTQNHVTETARNSHSHSNGNGLGAHSPPAEPGETSPRRGGWGGLRRCSQAGSRSMKRNGSTGIVFFAASDKECVDDVRAFILLRFCSI